jgi:hypothetical protein
VLIPPFVRAAGSLQIGRRESSALRLSRGYDGPVSKWKLAAPVVVTPRDIQVDESNANSSHRATAFEIDALSHHKHHPNPPDPLRGPPDSNSQPRTKN